MQALRFVLVVGLVVSCKGGGNSDGDGGVDAGAPSGWTCDPRGYGDGVVCHCGCGLPDPDCANADLIVSGCINDQTCAADGTCTYCGNGSVDVDEGEQCDSALPDQAECGPQGYQPGQVPCAASCRWAYDQCEPLLTCNNGALDTGELCDGTLIQAGLDCTDYNRTSGALACTAGCAIDASGCYTCGDGKVEATEACDDGDASGGDGCSGTCAVETGWQCAGAPSSCTPVCGDGMRVGAETCDDGNDSPNDGCSATCKIEQDCTCTGTPSVCSCATVQLVYTNPEWIDTASIVLDGTGAPHVTWFYGVDYTEAGTNYLKEHGHAMYAMRPATTWMASEIQTWDQTRTSLDHAEFFLSYDGGMLRQFMHRIYNAMGTFAVALRAGGAWTASYDNPYYIWDVVRQGGNYHALVEPMQFSGMRYKVGTPGAWTIDEDIAAQNFRNGYEMHLGVSTTGEAYVANMLPASGHTAYNLKVSRRVNATTWTTVYDVQTTGACVYPVMHLPLALGNGGMLFFEQGFSGSTQHWLKAHVFDGAAWVVEDVASLNHLPTTCSAGGTSYTYLKAATTVDAQGNPHIVYASPPYNASTMIEDHYRDGTGWHVRTFPLTKGTPLDMKIDASGTTHIVASQPGATSVQTKLVYIRISPSAW